MGGKELDQSTDCTVTPGSIVITLKQTYLNTLKPGTYALRATMHSGVYAEAQITVYAKPPQPPKTGDDTPVIWLGLICLLGITGFALLVRRRA